MQKGHNMNKMTRLTFVVLMVAVLVSPNIYLAKAGLGPVHVELNTTGDKPGGARANTVTAFKIHIQFNINIKTHDWVKVWFPIDEASCDKNKICDGLPKITGDKEHPRFVPNAKYFEKYPDSKEKDFGKIYQVLSDRSGETRFDECECATNENCCGEGKCRIVPDPSGLGCWMMGTILPQLPRKKEDTKKRLENIHRSTAIGYYVHDEASGIPILINTCEERSYRYNSPLEVDAWRKGYNPIDINTSKATGIIAPATPGRYRVFVATEPEPTPVESEMFVLPCSQITTPTVYVANAPKGKRTDMSIIFKTGEGGALDDNGSTISVKFPFEVQTKNLQHKEVSINGVKLVKPIQVSADGKTLTFECPTDVMGFEEVSLTICSVENLLGQFYKGAFRLDVWTSSEPEAVKSLPFEVIPQ